MALTKSPNAFAGADDWPVLLNRQNHVLTATGIKTALPAKDRAEHQLVRLN